MIDALLGRQFMLRAGGRPTTAWYGLHYVGQAGSRIPVPLFQAAECLAIWLLLLALERRVPIGRGVVVCGFLVLWGLARFNDEFRWLAQPRLWDAVEVTGLVMAGVGLAGALRGIWRSTPHRGVMSA